MTTTSANIQTNLSKFQGLLRELFQFDCADLDFGIYRIMNHKREAVEHFISKKLPDAVAAELASGPLAEQAKAAAVLSEVEQQVRLTFGQNALDDSGNLDPSLHQFSSWRGLLESAGRSRGRQPSPRRHRSPPSTITCTPSSAATTRKATSSPRDAIHATSVTPSHITARRSISTGQTATSTTSRATSTSATTTGMRPTVFRSTSV